MTGLDVECHVFLLGLLLFVMAYFIRNCDSDVIAYMHIYTLNMYYISYRCMCFVYIC